MCLVYLRCELKQLYVWLVHFEVKMPPKRRKNIFTDYELTKKEPLMFLDLKVLTER